MSTISPPRSWPPNVTSRSRRWQLIERSISLPRAWAASGDFSRSASLCMAASHSSIVATAAPSQVSACLRRDRTPRVRCRSVVAVGAPIPRPGPPPNRPVPDRARGAAVGRAGRPPARPAPPARPVRRPTARPIRRRGQPGRSGAAHLPPCRTRWRTSTSSTTSRWPTTSPGTTPCTARCPRPSPPSTACRAVVRRARLDAELVRRGLARSREQAAELVAAGRVQVAGRTATKPATGGRRRHAGAGRRPTRTDPSYVSRGGHKLAGALDAFAGAGRGPARASTPAPPPAGSPTCCCARGAREVVAVDVGYGQLAWPLRTDDGCACTTAPTSATLTPEQIGGPVELIVADLSFISLRAGAAGAGRAAPSRRRPAADGQAAVRGRPGAARRGRRGPRPGGCGPRRSARSPPRASELGWARRGVTRSPLPGPAGNVEFFLWLRRDAPPVRPGRDREAVGGSRERPLEEQRDEPATRAAGHAHRPRGTCVDRRPRGQRAAAGRRASQVRMLGRTRPAELGVTDVKRSSPDESGGGRLRGRAACSAATARSCGRPSWPARPGAAARGQPRPGRLPRRDRAGGAARHGPARSSSAATGGGAAHPRRRRHAVDGGVVARDWALNEASVEKTKRERMLEVVVEVDGRPLTSFGCDGVVCATPTGSTAYAFSAGGPVVWPEVRGAAGGAERAHALFARPLVISPDVDGGDHGRRRRPRRRARLRRPAHLARAGRRAGDRPARRAAGAASPVRTRCRSPTGWWPSSGCRSAASGPAGSGSTDRACGRFPHPDARSGYASGVLSEIRIRGLGVIEDVTLELGPGLTVVTGETGAGKTMVVTGLQPAASAAGPTRPGAVRLGPGGGRRAAAAAGRLAGAGRARSTPAPRSTRTASCWSPAHRGEGRSRAYLGGSAVPAGLLGELAEGVLAVHGQSDQLRLLQAGRAARRPGPVRRPLAEKLVDRHREAFATWRPAGRRPGRPDGAGRASWPGRPTCCGPGLDEIAAVEPQPGEDGELRAEAERLAHADALRLAARTAHVRAGRRPDDPAADARRRDRLLGGGAAGSRRASRPPTRSWPRWATGWTRRPTWSPTSAPSWPATASGWTPTRPGWPRSRSGGPRSTALTRKYGATDVDEVLAWADRGRERLADLDVSDDALAALAAERDGGSRRRDGRAGRASCRGPARGGRAVRRGR